jgi:hypothetical protein
MVLADLREAYMQRVKIRLVLSLIGAFLVSMVMSCQELKYMVSGKTVDAQLEQSRIEKQPGRFGTQTKRILTYSFNDAGTFRREYAELPSTWNDAHGQTVKIQYLPGKERQSRIHGQRNWFWLAVFFTSLALAVAGAISILRQK